VSRDFVLHSSQQSTKLSRDFRVNYHLEGELSAISPTFSYSIITVSIAFVRYCQYAARFTRTFCTRQTCYTTNFVTPHDGPTRKR
jgi:hypothetical protein